MTTFVRRLVLGAVTLVGALAGAVAPAGADTFFFMTKPNPENVVPPAVVTPGTDPTGLAIVKLVLNKNFSGNVISAFFDFLVGLTGFESTDAVTKLEIGEAPAGVNDSVIEDDAVAPPEQLIDGKALLLRQNKPTEFIFSAGQIPSNPAGFFFRVLTQNRPTGALRGQLQNGPLQGVGGSVVTNKRSFAGGDRFKLSALLGNLGAAIDLDVFAGLVLGAQLGGAACPGPGNFALIFFGPAGTFAQECLANLPGAPLKFTTLNLPTNGPMQDLPVVEFDMPAGLPAETSQAFICYRNPLGQPLPPVCDTRAFATDP